MTKKLTELPGIRAVLLGEQGSGKSLRERRWTDQIVNWRVNGRYVYRCTLVLDRFNEDEIWHGAGPVVSSVEEFWDVCEQQSRSAGLDDISIVPRIIVRCGMDPKNYIPFLRLAIDEGNFLLVLCEVRQFAQSHKRGFLEIGRGITLEHVFFGGRHIPDRDGEPQRIGYICDTQQAVGLSTVLRNEAIFVACGPLEGRNNLDYVRDEFGDGKTLVERVRAARGHEWTILRNKLDRRVPRFPLEVTP